MAVGSSWREQYNRMIRWKHRLWLDPILHQGDAADSVYAFAQSCYHLVDWLGNDSSQDVRRAEAKAYVRSSPALAFCADVCNGSAHARLEPKQVRVMSTKHVDAVQLLLPDETGQAQEIKVERTELSVEWAGADVGIEEFAEICVSEWDRFLRERRLLDPDAGMRFLVARDACSLLRKLATTLSPGALAALEASVPLFGGMTWELSCSPLIAREIHGWLNQAGQSLAQIGREDWARHCRLAAGVIAEGLASQPISN